MKKLLALLIIFSGFPVYSYFKYSQSPSLASSPTATTAPRVLGDSTLNEQLYFTVNIPAKFNKGITAPNVVYSVNGETGDINIDNSLVAGTGISVDERTISVNLTAGDGISIDGSTITNSGVKSLTAGTNISIDGTTINSTYAADYTQSGWTDNGTSITLTTTTDSVTVGTLTAGAVTVDSLTTGGLSLTDDLTVSSGHSLLPEIDLGSDIGSSSYRFNNLWVANINSNSSQSFSGQTTFSYPPTDTTITEASVLINPTTSVANGQLLGLGIAGYQRALIDEDGDLILGYSDATSAPATDYPLDIYGHSGTRVAYVDGSGNINSSAQILASDGSASLPSYSFGSETNTGLYYPTANTLRLTTGGTNRYQFSSTGIQLRYANDLTWSSGSIGNASDLGLFRNSAGVLEVNDGSHGSLATLVAGNVGIGTTSPSSLLHINGGVLTVNGLTSDVLGSFTSTNNRASIKLADSSATGYVVTEGGNIGIGPSVYNSASNLNVQISSGNVGIGTTSPRSGLDVYGGNVSANRFVAYSNDSHISGAYKGVYSQSIGGSTMYYTSQIQNSYGGIDLKTDAGPNGRPITLRVTNPGDFGYISMYTDDTERLRLDSSGNVGIGTTSPQYNLDISGYTRIVGAGEVGGLILSNGISSGTLKWNSASYGGFVFNGQITMGGGASANYARISNSAASETTPVFSLRNDTNTGIGSAGADILSLISGGVNGLNVDGSGNVGIGTTSPGAKLQIGDGSSYGASTGLMFGDGDTGLYEYTDDGFVFKVGGNQRFILMGDQFRGYSGNPGMRAVTSTSTTPNHLPNYTDTDTGIGSAGDNILSLIAGGTNGLNVISSGNVGIGTTLPQSKLSVAGAASLGSTYAGISAPTNGLIVEGNVGIGTSNPSSILTTYSASNVGINFTSAANSGVNIVSSGSTNEVQIKFDGGSSVTDRVVGINGQTDLFAIARGNNWIDSLTPDFVIDNSGNVGIGTTSPGGILEIVDSDNSNVGFKISRNDTGDPYSLGMSSYTGGLGRITAISDSGAYRQVFQFGDSTASGNIFGLGYSLDSGSNWNSAMTVSYNGNVGIGTTSPGAKLHTLTTSDGNALKLEVPATSITSQDFYLGNAASSVYISMNPYILEMKRNGGASTIKTVGSGNDLILQSQQHLSFNTGGASERVRINSSGNVGIGTTSPGAKLDVNGAINTNSTITASSTINGNNYVNTASGVYAWKNTSITTGRLYTDGGLISYGAKLQYKGAGINFVDSSDSVNFSVEQNGLVDATTGGIATYTKAGTISDTDFTDTPTDGLLGVDSTNGRLYVRNNSGTWNYIAFTGGFQIPDFEAGDLEAGDLLIPYVEKKLSDGALHGLYKKLDLGEILGDQSASISAELSASVSAEIAQVEERVGMLEGLVEGIQSLIGELQNRWDQLAEKLTTKKIYTEELCVGTEADSTCLSKEEVDQLKNLLPTPAPSVAPSASPEPSIEPTPVATDSGSI